jgi:hypothetical protein
MPSSTEVISIPANTSKSLMCAHEKWSCAGLRIQVGISRLEEIHHAAINNPAYDPIRHVLFREAQGLRPGGYGVLMTRHLVDELVYSEKGNEVLLVKYLFHRD